MAAQVNDDSWVDVQSDDGWVDVPENKPDLFMGPQLQNEQPRLNPIQQPQQAPQESFLQGVGRRFLYGPNEQDTGGSKVIGGPTGNSILPEMQHPADEGWLGWGMRGLYNNIVRPLGSAEGMIGAAQPGKSNVVGRLKAGSAQPINPTGRLVPFVQQPVQVKLHPHIKEAIIDPTYHGEELANAIGDVKPLHVPTSEGNFLDKKGILENIAEDYLDEIESSTPNLKNIKDLKAEYANEVNIPTDDFKVRLNYSGDAVDEFANINSDHPLLNPLKLNEKSPEITSLSSWPGSEQITNAVPELTPQEKLLEALRQSKPLNKEQAKIYASERAQKIAQVKGIETPGQEGAQQKLTALAGEHTKVRMEPLVLEQPDVDNLFDMIHKHEASIGFDQIHAITGLNRVLNGEVPRQFEIAQLERVFGKEVVDKVKTGNLSLIADAVNTPRKIQATLDLSAPLRQGLGMIHKKEFWTSLPEMFKSWGSEEAYNAVKEGIESRPTFKLMQDSKLALTDFGLGNREEQVLSSLIDKLPGVRRSDRAYMAFLNQLRADSFDSVVKNATKAGLNPEENLMFTKQLAGFINAATGRGSLGNMERYAGLLNTGFFSPRLISSRLKMLNPNTYLQIGNELGAMSPEAGFLRKEYLKSLFSIAAVGTTVTELARLGGAEVENDPTSADFRKAKIGNTRLDPYGGFQQYITLAAKLIENSSKSTTSGNVTEFGTNAVSPTRLSTIMNAAEQKSNPAVNFVTGWLRGKNFKGEPFHVPEEVASRVTPMILRDLWELSQEDPELLPIAGPLGALGMGVQTYR